MMTETELWQVTTIRMPAGRLVLVRMRRHMTEMKLGAAKLWRQAINPTGNEELALMLVDRCVECLRRAKAIEKVLRNRAAHNPATGLSSGY
jgi:hypothetical protein